MNKHETSFEQARRDYLSAQSVQDACNLSGVVHEFSRILSRMVDSPDVYGLADRSTDARNRHPISVMFASKIAHLTGQTMGAEHLEHYAQAAELCRARAAELEVRA